MGWSDCTRLLEDSFVVVGQWEGVGVAGFVYVQFAEQPFLDDRCVVPLVVHLELATSSPRGGAS